MYAVFRKGDRCIGMSVRIGHGMRQSTAFWLKCHCRSMSALTTSFFGDINCLKCARLPHPKYNSWSCQFYVNGSLCWPWSTVLDCSGNQHLVKRSSFVFCLTNCQKISNFTVLIVGQLYVDQLASSIMV